MPNTVKISENNYITILRRKTIDTGVCWVDAYGTKDGGVTWKEEFTVRENSEEYPDADLGYPRLVCRNDGSLVAIYYWVRPDNPEQYIEAAKWEP